jgi:hypothetical protein
MAATLLKIAMAALLAGAAFVASAAAAPPTQAQLERGASSATDFSAQRRYRRAPARLTVYPWWRYYRQCVDWYAVEARASGPTVVPQMRCRWAVR